MICFRASRRKLSTGVDSFRLDALKHINPGFYPEWLGHLENHFQKSFFCIGEYWQNSVEVLLKFIDVTQGKIQLFDVPLHHRFREASEEGERYDLRNIFNNTLLQQKPELAVTFVDNHDTQPLQSLQSPVQAWFTPIAYAMILLRQQGIPCIFYPALYDAKYLAQAQDGQEVYIELNRSDIIKQMIKIRRSLAYGEQYDYFDHPNVVGWARTGISEMPGSGCVVLISTTGDAEKWMSMGEQHSGKTMIDATGSITESLVLNDHGEGMFKVKAGSVSIWIDQSQTSL